MLFVFCFKERKQQLEKEKAEVEELRSEREGQPIKNIYQLSGTKLVIIAKAYF